MYGVAIHRLSNFINDADSLLKRRSWNRYYGINRAAIWQIMKITLLQRDIIWADPEANRHRNDCLFTVGRDSDLYIFPEMFSTGFCTQPEGIAEKVPSGTLEWMRNKAVQFRCAVAGSIAVTEEGRYFNRFYFVFPNGNVMQYDKRHLFTFGEEHLRFTPGQERIVITYKGVRILPQICYDLRFPVWSRNRGDYDMIVYVASWPKPRTNAWKQLLRARAIENQCYVAGVNRCGNDPDHEYEGGTVILDPHGEVMAECPDGIESEISAEIELDRLNEIRKNFPVLNDADHFTVEKQRFEPSVNQTEYRQT